MVSRATSSEIINVIQRAGITPDGSDLTQLRQAIEALVSTAVNNVTIPPGITLADCCGAHRRPTRRVMRRPRRRGSGPCWTICSAALAIDGISPRRVRIPLHGNGIRRPGWLFFLAGAAAAAVVVVVVVVWIQQAGIIVATCRGQVALVVVGVMVAAAVKSDRVAVTGATAALGGWERAVTLGLGPVAVVAVAAAVLAVAGAAMVVSRRQAAWRVLVAVAVRVARRVVRQWWLSGLTHTRLLLVAVAAAVVVAAALRAALGLPRKAGLAVPVRVRVAAERPVWVVQAVLGPMLLAVTVGMDRPVVRGRH